MKKDFKEYLEKLEGMDRIELILDLLVEGKITKEQAVVLIASDKVVKLDYRIHYTNPSWTTTIPGTVYNTPSITTTASAPYTTYANATITI